MYIYMYIYIHKLHASVWHLLIFILSGKNGKSQCKIYKFLELSALRINPSSLSSSYFFMKPSLNLIIFLFHLNLPAGSF